MVDDKYVSTEKYGPRVRKPIEEGLENGNKDSLNTTFLRDVQTTCTYV